MDLLAAVLLRLAHGLPIFNCKLILLSMEISVTKIGLCLFDKSGLPPRVDKVILSTICADGLLGG